MLTALCIKNFTIVSELELDFNSGMSVFTGETGAGKSIMIDALVLALGGRADGTVIRPGADSCDIQACFALSAGTGVAQWLADQDIPADNELYLRRVITREGRSKAYINGIVFPLQKVKELGVMLVHIHGQHEHQTLFSAATHRDQLDHFAQHTVLRQQLATAYRHCQRLKAEQATLAATIGKDTSLLEENFQEWQTLHPKEGEIETLHQEHQFLHHTEDYAQHTQSLLQLLQNEEEAGVQTYLHMALQNLNRLPQDHPQIQTARSLLEQARIVCEEAYDELDRFGQSLVMDPQRLQEIESRMSALHHLARKWHISVQELPAQGQILEQALQDQQNIENRQQQLTAEYAKAQELYYELAAQIRSSRQEHAKRLASQITMHIQQLGMPHGRIELTITPLETMQEHGMDKIEYQVATNPGMPLELLTKIASGGELSRISLAIQLVAAQQESTPTLVFDEVDVGIGGNTAAIVGRLLRQLGKRLQVFCVTHQPQVAASADQHFLVQKYSDAAQTFSKIIPLTATEKIEELARMLGGLTITAQTRSHAQELLETLTR